MAAQYVEMWKSLGLNLANHDALLSVLGKAYGDVFMSQKNRPEGMAYLDFVMSEIHGLRVKELVDARAAGRKVIGCYCTFVPEELILAVGGISVGLCAGANFATEEVERLLPRNTCALIKSSLGFKLGGVCPYLEACDLVVGENTCDGKKKAYETFSKVFKKPFHVVDLPNSKTDEPRARATLRDEYARFLTRLEEVAGRKATAADILEGIRIVNAKREALQRLARTRAADPAPISGLDALLVSQISFFDDPVRFTASVNKLCDELEQRAREGKGAVPKGTPRILVSGCPMSVPNWKVPIIVETSGVVVGEESCVGERGTRGSVTAAPGTAIPELLDAIAQRYMQIDCAVFSPNDSRLEHIKEMAKAYKADGVILYGLHFCTPYVMEAMSIEEELEHAGVPAIRIETDYSEEDTAQLKTRIEAFIERIHQ